jgi:glutathione peroxidase
MNAFDFTARDITGQERPLAEWRGQVLLIVNVASQCGYTPQYEGLEALHRSLAPRGFAVLGFPCDQFGNQEPGSEEQIASFCSTTYGVSFPMFAKIEINGDGAHPLYRFLKAERPGILGTEAIKWNFTKFLVDRTGAVCRRYAPGDTPEAIAAEVERLVDKTTG